MRTATKQQELLASLNAHFKGFLDGGLKALDALGYRNITNHFLSDLLGYQQLEETKMEYMVKGIYKDYVIIEIQYTQF